MGGLHDLRLFWSVESGMEDVGKGGGQVNVTSVWTWTEFPHLFMITRMPKTAGKNSK